jgi:hypothetical protein
MSGMLLHVLSLRGTHRGNTNKGKEDLKATGGVSL